MNRDRCAIVGTGSLAAAAGWLLQESGFPFFVIARKGPTAWSCIFTTEGVQYQVTTAVPLDLTTTKLVLVCVKAYDLEQAYEHVSLFKQPVHVLTFANGATAALIKSAQRRWPQHTFRLGFATVGVTALHQDRENGASSPQNQYHLRSRGGVFQFGPTNLNSNAEEPSAAERRLAEIAQPVGPELSAATLRFAWSRDAALLQRRKWLFNTVINTLTAARRLKNNGELLVDTPMLTAVFEEAWHLAERVFGPWPPSRPEFSRGDLYAAMVRLIGDTQENENSMAADIRLGRRTESPFLAGLAEREGGTERFPLLVSLHQKIVNP